MATTAELRDRAANELGLLPVGQTLASNHSTRITEGFNEVYAQLAEDGLNIWASTAECPDRIVPQVVALIAFNCLNTYPVSPERYQRITFTASQAVKSIRSMVRPAHESTDEPTDY